MAYTTINKHTDYFNTKLWTGTGSENAITGIGFRPDWVWIKERNNTTSHRSFDVLRGATYEVFPDLTDAHSADAQSLKSFDSDGFTLGTDGATNGSSDTYVAWNWKAETSGSGTTTGSGTGKDYQYSVNTTAGFSIVKYKGNGTAGHTIPHHLGVVPQLVIVKCIESVHSWQVYHHKVGHTKYLELNTSNAEDTETNRWNDTAPTSSVFTLGNSNTVNQSSSNYNFIAYCFAEKTGYSKFGSYTGNGNADGTFIYTGFKPSLIIGKRTDSSSNGNWIIWDNKRNGYNPNQALFPNSSSAELAYASENIDIYSNGWKQKGSGFGNSGNFIYIAFGQSLVGSNNVPCTAR